jgi:hypothetical protein
MMPAAARDAREAKMDGMRWHEARERRGLPLAVLVVLITVGLSAQPAKKTMVESRES